MKCDFLIVTNKIDPHTDSVMRILEKRGFKIFRFNTEDFYKAYKIILTQENSTSHIKLINRLNGKYLETGDKKIVAYFRKPSKIIPNSDCIDEASELISKQEANKTLNMLYNSNLFYWINNYQQRQLASAKNLQIETAIKLGLNFPDTIITNSKRDAVQFYEKHNGNVIIKPLGSNVFVSEDNFYSIFTSVLDSETFYKNIDTIDLAPVFLQKHILKKHELRISVFGNDIFPCLIDSQSNEISKIDWRKIEPGEIDHKIVEIPKSISSKLIKFNKMLGLEFGMFDFIITNDNEYFFLENNPNGQWFWIELITGAKLSESMSNLLEKNYAQQRV